MVFIINCLFQVLLLFLMLYPLYKHLSQTSAQMQSRELATKIKIVMKRLAACTGVCVVSDLALVAALKFICGRGSSGISGQILSSFHLFINVFSLCLSFANWKDRVLLCRLRWKKNISNKLSTIT